jgi:hypothetical protein
LGGHTIWSGWSWLLHQASEIMSSDKKDHQVYVDISFLNVPRIRYFYSCFHCFFFFLNSRKPHSQESALCGPRWASKTSAVPGSYKRCTFWPELETCCADLKPFTITLRPLGTCFHCWLLNRTNSRLKIWYKKFY